VTLRWLAAAATTAVAVAGHAQEAPPALLEPYAGYDVVFGPQAARVLGPEAAPAIERMLSAAGPEIAPGCSLGDIGIEATRIALKVQCAGAALTFGIAARGRGQPASDDATAVFVISGGSVSQPAVKAELLRRVRAGEAGIPWQRVRAQRGSSAGSFAAGLNDAQRACAVGDRETARRHLNNALAARPLTALEPHELLDVALLAGEASAATLQGDAAAMLKRALAKAGRSAGDGKATFAPLEPAALALAGAVTEAVDRGLVCARRSERPCDVVPLVRTLAATHHYEEAARVLDLGPLTAPGTPPRELLKLRFGLASALRNADAELALGLRWQQAFPDDPRGPDLVATGLARMGRHREAIELLHDLYRRHPERDIVLGRIAGLVNFLTEAAGTDATLKADLAHVEARMHDLAHDPTDVVARFIVATRAYYAGRLDEAVPLLEALQQSGNRDPRLPLYLAMAHYWLGHHAEAVKLIQHAVDIGPSDPDVFYCRSQIVRRWNLPLAIADLKRYESMTSQPWSIGPVRKSQRVKAELAYLERGELPPDWDKPGPERAKFEPETQAGTPVSQAVREGTVALPGEPTPDKVVAIQLPQRPTPAATDDMPAGRPRPWLPLVLLASVIAALAVRWWTWRTPPQ
jgi:tetratricopeptide (TPR) repeat protein